MVSPWPSIDKNDPEWFYKLATSPSYRVRGVRALRLDTPKRANPGWAVRELLYYATVQNEDLSDTILVVTLKYGMHDSMAKASTPLPGRRIFRLLYDWRDVEPCLPNVTVAQLSNTVLAKMAEPGGVFRARVRYVAYLAETERGKAERG